MKKWAAEFIRSRESLEDNSRSGLPCTTTTQENIERIPQMAMDSRHLTVNHIAHVMGISHKRVENILLKELGMSKVLAR